ncbi:hypothetical protein [Amycolatopsis arida]|uniref:hypothetical protein n=1 Tax=Amycolatopsis arida TaxID=587909 RepID=UPI000B82B342|nr:hypothetical protein [Amycolatopsis arida]
MDNIVDFVADNPMAAVIAAGEVGFWVFIVAGLTARYLLRLPRTGVVLLAATPLIDLVVLVVTMVDLTRGAQATWVHGLAAVYLGFSVVFGPSMIRWADAHVAHRFAGGPAPTRPPRGSTAKRRHEWREWGKCLLACALAGGAMLLLIFVAGSPEQTRQLWATGGWLPRLGWVVGIWFVVGPLWAELGPRDGDRAAARDGS